MSGVSIRTESLGGSALSRAARAGELGEWYRTAPHGNAWRAYADDVRRSVSASWYEDLAPALAPTGHAADRLARSARGKGIIVTSGQQPGLFGGPLYSLVKALSARALADQLEAQLGIPAAPVFWAATDDADFTEASVVTVALEGGPRELRVPARSAPGIPMSHAPMPVEDVEPFIEVLREASGSAPHSHFLNEAIRCYREGGTVGGAYVALMRGLLEPLGIAVLDASHPAVALAGRDVLVSAARHTDAVARAVRERMNAIEAAGFTPQVDEVPGLSLVFAQENGIKRRLTVEEAAGIRDDAALSPTVLLRPVLERAILPTVAYLGGPGEIAYFAQVGAVAQALGVAIPMILPRWSMTIIEPRVQKILDEFGLSPDELADPHAADTELAHRRMPSRTDDALRALREDLAAAIQRLRLASDGLVPDAVVQGLQNSLSHKIGRTERRFVAAVKRREADAMRRLATARGLLFPFGVRQERSLSFIPFLARYGEPLIEEMLKGADAHARILVSGSPSMASSTPSAAASV